jgi:hypothetical protein
MPTARPRVIAVLLDEPFDFVKVSVVLAPWLAKLAVPAAGLDI